MDESIDYKAIVENLQADNEKLREQIAKLKFNAINWYTILTAIYDIVTTAEFAIGFAIGVILMIVLLVGFKGA